MHRSTFPQSVEKKVENRKILGKHLTFRLLKKIVLFNISENHSFVFSFRKCGFSFSIPCRILFSHHRICVSTKLPTFFPFPQSIFSRFSTDSLRHVFIHKTARVFHSRFPSQRHVSDTGKIQRPSAFFRLFQLFYTI